VKELHLVLALSIQRVLLCNHIHTNTKYSPDQFYTTRYQRLSYLQSISQLAILTSPFPRPLFLDTLLPKNKKTLQHTTSSRSCSSSVHSSCMHETWLTNPPSPTTSTDCLIHDIRKIPFDASYHSNPVYFTTSLTQPRHPRPTYPRLIQFATS
jgi:hypothetical protein